MKPLQNLHRRQGAFTLIELLVVISIIAILAALTMSAVSKAKLKARISQTKIQMKEIEAAVAQYVADNGRPPVSPAAQNSINPTTCPDFTYGIPGSLDNIGQTTPYQMDNRELIAILTDLETFQNGTPTVNAGHVLNPKKLRYLNAKPSPGPNRPGINDDGVYRDPWGNPYIVTIDLNFEGNTRDAFYRRSRVSQETGSKGYHGLSSPNNGASTDYDADTYGDDFELRMTVMVWSLGPDGKANTTQKANDGDNLDNILGWK